MTDPIADMLTRIRNANMAKHDSVEIPASKMKLSIAEILLNEGYIKSYEVVGEGVHKNIVVNLKYGADKLLQASRESPSLVFVYTPAQRICPRYSAVSVSRSFPPTRA